MVEVDLATGLTDVYILVCKGCTKVTIVLIRAPIDIFMLSDVLKSDSKILDPNSFKDEGGMVKEKSIG